MPKPSSKGASPKAPNDFILPYVPWEKQARVHDSDARFRVIMAGRQSGKTMLGIAEICDYAMSYPKMVLWWICPNYTVKPRAWRGLLEFVPPQFIVRKNEAEKFIELGNGSSIWIKSADAKNSLVSEGLDGVVCDEAGQWAESAWTMGIRPMLGPSFKKRDEENPRRGWAIFIGTPRGRNWFHRIWLRGEAKAEATEEGGGTWESFHWKSIESPYSSSEDIDEARNTLPRDTFLQEYEADPHDNAQAVFRNHRQCIAPMGEPDGRSCLGIDLARKHDFTAVVGLNSTRRVFHVEKFQLEWPQQRQRIAALSLQTGAFLEVDATGPGDAFIPSLREAGMQVEEYVIGSNPAKTSLVDYLRVQFEQNSISIPDDPDLLNELDTFEFQVAETDDEKRKPLERYQYGAPPGGHDDLVIALALAAWGLRGIPVYASQGNQVTNYLGHRRMSDNYLR